MGKTRDRFMAAALQGVIAAQGLSGRDGSEGVARRAAEFADAMMTETEGEKSGWSRV